MNLLNKKLIDKIKILDDIDKQYILNIKSKKNNELNGNNSDIKNNNDNCKKENFNKIYSGFFDEKKFSYYDGKILIQNYYISNNNYDKEPTNENSIEKEKNESFSQKGLIKTNSIEKNLSNNDNHDNDYDIINEAQNKNDLNYEVDVVERLNNYGNYIKQKIEYERERQYYKIKQRMKPEILPRSKNISRNNKKVDIFEKLYKNNIANNKNKKNLLDNNSISKSTSNFNQNSTFSYRPQLNKKSLLMAKKFESSFIRLNQKKNKKNNIGIKPETYYGNLYEKSLFTNKSSKSIRHNNKNNLSPSEGLNKKKEGGKTIYEKMNNLYLRGVEQRHKKEKSIEENQKKKQEEYKKYTFRPKLYKNTSFTSKIKKKNNSNKNKNIYNKNIEWKKKIENEIKKKKDKKENNEIQLCTFKPQLCETKYHNNDKLIYKALDQMNYYITKRKDNLKHKNLEEEYKNKKLGINQDDYVARSTIPMEFDLKTEKRGKDFSKNKNKSCDNFHRNKIIEQNSKKILNNETENKYWFFKDNINGYSCNKICEPQKQINFVEAVNLLHDKLDKLNI